jgi:PAS domain S-box-containing protein
MKQTMAADTQVLAAGKSSIQRLGMPAIAAAAVVVTGVLVLAGWMPDGIDQGGWPKVDSGAALSFVLCGFSLFLVEAEPLARWRRYFVLICAGSVALFALLTMGEHLAGREFASVQRVISTLAGAPAQPAPERMAPTTALCFFLAGAALLLLTQASPTRLVASLRLSLAAFVAGFGAVAVVGHAADAVLGFPGWNFTGTSVMAAVPLMLLGLGQVSVTARRHDWIWALERTTTVCFVTGLILLVAVCAVTYRALNSFADTTTRVAQTLQVQAETGQLQRALIEAVAGWRNFVQTRDARQLENLRKVVARAHEHLATLKKITAANALQHERIAELERLLIGPLTRVTEVLATPDMASVTAGLPAPPRAQPANEALIRIIGQINDEEQALLQGRQKEADRNFDLAVAVVPTGMLGSVLLLSMALFISNREAGDRKRAQSDLQESGRRYRMLFESSPLPTWVFDLETRRFVAVNAAAISFYGYSREEFATMSITDIRPSEEIAPLLEVVTAPPSTGSFKSARTWKHRKKDGSIVLMEITTHELLFDGRAARLVLANDMTARVLAEEEIRLLNAELENRVRQRTAQLEGALKEIESFSYSVSHDLRAPLRHVQGYVAMLQQSTQGQLSEKAQRHLKMINDASVQMGQLIDDLLEFSRMGRVGMSEGHVPLDELVRECLRGLEMQMQGRDIRWKIAEPLPTVVGDVAMLRQVVTNLLGNAIKYSRHRHPAEIEVGCAGDEDGRVIVFVRDNGAGFDMKYAHKLFGVFQRLHRADEFEGTGIGLATVHRVVSRHGGRVWAEGAIDQGATFYFTLRRRPEAPSSPSA